MIEGLTFDQRAREDREGMKILIIDEHPLMRAALANVLAGLSQRVGVLQADSLDGALAALEAHANTSLVLLDLLLADSEGANAIARLRQSHAGIPVVVLSSVTDRATVTAAIRAGAMGFISKRSTPPVLLSALRLVLAGEVYIPPEVLRMQAPERAAEPALGAAAALGEPPRRGEELGLTRRQLDVLALLVQGKPNKVICRELGLAEGTVKTHTAAIFRALRVSNRTEAGFAVSRLGIQIPSVQPRGGDSPHAMGRTLALSV
jgi:DNA-binding NarL/FixJ family response regulator